MADSKDRFRTQLSEDELQHFKEKIEEEKNETERKIEELKSSAESINENADDRKSGTDHHPGDVASDAQIKKTNLTLLEKQREKHNKTEAALERIESGTYGVCLATCKPIQKERFDAMPYVMHAIDTK